LVPERVEYLPVRTYWTGGWLGIVVELKELAKCDISALAGNRTVIPALSSPVSIIKQPEFNPHVHSQVLKA
jgi:hypothetical protein